MCLIFRRPAIPEESYRDKDSARNHEWHAKFGLADAVVATFQKPVDAVLERSTDLRAKEEAGA